MMCYSIPVLLISRMHYITIVWIIISSLLRNIPDGNIPIGNILALYNFLGNIPSGNISIIYDSLWEHSCWEYAHYIWFTLGISPLEISQLL